MVFMLAPSIPAHSGEEERLRSELEEAHASLEREAAFRRTLERAVIASWDDERHRLAHLLHDTTCQSLNGIGLLSHVILRKLQRKGAGEIQEMEELRDAITGAIAEIHSVVDQVGIAETDGEGLVPALARLAMTCSGPVPCIFDCPHEVLLPDAFTTSQLIQIAHQAVNDALRRDGVTNILLSLGIEDSTVTLSVQDDGQVAPGKPGAPHLDGREMMCLRASAIGSSLVATFHPDQGNTITCTLPLPC